MRNNRIGRRVSLRDCLADIINNGLPYDTPEEKAISDEFSATRKFADMMDKIIDEVQEHVDYNVSEIIQ